MYLQVAKKCVLRRRPAIRQLAKGGVREEIEEDDGRSVSVGTVHTVFPFSKRQVKSES